MARRSYRRKKSPARAILMVVLPLLAGAVVWRVWLYEPESIIDKNQLDQVMQNRSSGGGGETSSNNIEGTATNETIPPGNTISTLPNNSDNEGNIGDTGSDVSSGTDPGAAEIRAAAELERAKKLFEQGRTAWQAKNYLAARDALSEAVTIGLAPETDSQARQILNEAANLWLFSPDIYEGDEFCRRYRVSTGDMLVDLQKKFAVPYKLLMRMNNIASENKLPAGKNIKVVQGPFHAVVYRNSFLMSVYLGDVLVRSYPVGLGRSGRQTPTGLWRVRLKQENPAWYDEEEGKNYLPNDPDNPLGERWIALEGLEGTAKGRTGFGIHGTIKPDEIGRASSRGCIRLYNGDVRELYDLLIESQSLVRVVD